MKKISVIMMIVIISTFIFSGCGKEYVEGTKLRCDGVYQSKIKGSNGEFSYICFFEEGKAATVSDSSIDSPKKAYEAFHDGSIICKHSTSFKTSSGIIVKKDQGGKTVEMAPTCEFTIQVNTGITTYTCYLKNKVLECDIVNPIRTTNNKIYEFVPVN